MRTSRRFKLRGNRSGAMYLIAVTTMLVGLTLSLVMLQSAVNYFNSEMSRSRKAAAKDLADAGADYAYWQIHYNGQPLPYSANVNLNNGSFQVSATDNGSQSASSAYITSTGTCSGYNYTVKRVTLGLLPYHYAWCTKGSLNTANSVFSNTSTRGLRGNSSITLSSYGNSVTTGIWAAGAISTHGTATPQNPSSPQVYFPTIDYSHYYSIATQTYWHDVWVWGLSSAQNQVIVVNGDVTLDSVWYSGVWTIVATGNIDIQGNLQPANGTSYLALITNQNISIESWVGTVQAVLYAHASDNGAWLVLHNNNTTIGSMCADNISVSTGLTYYRTSSIDLRVMRLLNLPGL